MNEEIAIRFQPNEIHQAILNGLETKEILEEVENNIEKTYERTKDNTGFIATLITVSIALAGLFISQEEVRKLVHSHIVVSLLLLIILALFLILIRKKIIGLLSMLKIQIPYILKKIKIWFNK